jgi:hypothetical protein
MRIAAVGIAMLLSVGTVQGQVWAPNADNDPNGPSAEPSAVQPPSLIDPTEAPLPLMSRAPLVLQAPEAGLPSSTPSFAWPPQPLQEQSECRSSGKTLRVLGILSAATGAAIVVTAEVDKDDDFTRELAWRSGGVFIGLGLLLTLASANAAC